jgi:orotate phosphoribosyltransferase-like protein
MAEADAMHRQNELARKAHEMKRAGASWWDIAEELGITEFAASTLVSERIRAAADLVDRGSKLEMLDLELERLDEMQWAIYGRARKGDLKAIETVLKIQEKRVKYAGLEDLQAGAGSTTLVVSGDSAAYIAALQEGAKQRELEAG